MKKRRMGAPGALDLKVQEVIAPEPINTNLPEEIPLKEDELKVYEALQQGASPLAAVRAAGLRMESKTATTYCAQVQNRNNARLMEAMEKKGVTFDLLAEKIMGQLEATKLVASREGVITTDDNSAIQGAINIALDVIPGARAPKQMEVKSTSLEAIIMQIEGRVDG